MNTVPLLRMLGLAIATAGGLASVAGASTEPARETAPKTHVIFVGADLAVQRDKKFYRVEDVVGSELKIRIGPKEFFVPTRNRMTGLKVMHGLKLSTVSAKLDDLQSGPSYTPANDPVRKFDAAAGAAGGAAAVSDLAQGQLVLVTAAEGQAARSAEAYPDVPAAQENAVNLRKQLAEAERKEAVLGHMLRYDSQNIAGAQADRMQGEKAAGNYDAMEVSFKISSPVELDDPHMVILFKFQERDAKAGTGGLLIHAESLEPVGAKPKYIRVRKAGLPPGFKYLDCEVHLFNRGEEVATNASSKRLELTRGEAQQYLVIEHVGANKGATLPAAVVPGSMPPARLKELSADQINRTFYARVGKDGAVLGLFADESCHLQLDDAAARAAVGDLFFRPALVKGQPVEGVARVRLGDI